MSFTTTCSLKTCCNVLDGDLLHGGEHQGVGGGLGEGQEP